MLASDEALDVLVVEGDSTVVGAAVLSAIELQHPRVRLVRPLGVFDRALARNLGLAEADSATLVFLDAGVLPHDGWWAPLREGLATGDLLGVQPVVLDRAGLVASAGLAFSGPADLPHEVLGGFPVEDVHSLAGQPLHALAGAAPAMRAEDLVAIHGFDPAAGAGFDVADACLRLAQTRSGHFAVLPDVTVTLAQDPEPRGDTGEAGAEVLAGRRIFAERWAGRLPQDSAEVWHRCGFDVIRHEVRRRDSEDRRLCVPEPVLRFRRPLEVVEGYPVLRWSIKTAAPAGAEGERWGDTHFARHLATALRGLGQQVSIDRREAMENASEPLEDVAVLLRGLVQHAPLVDRVNLMWLISHPELLVRSEPIGWDRIYVASIPFARHLAERWGAPAVAMLQATDPEVFHPDLAEPDTGEELLFVGNSRGTERPLVVGAARLGLPLSVYGGNWEGLPSVPPRQGRPPPERLGRCGLPGRPSGAQRSLDGHARAGLLVQSALRRGRRRRPGRQ